MNKVLLVGRIVANPELKNANDSHYVNFAVAINKYSKDEFGDKKQYTEFINCIVWNKPAVNLSKYVEKGQLLSIEGHLTSRTVEDLEGNKKRYTSVYCEKIEYLGKKNKNTENLKEEEEDLPFIR